MQFYYFYEFIYVLVLADLDDIEVYGESAVSHTTSSSLLTNYSLEVRQLHLY